MIAHAPHSLVSSPDRLRLLEAGGEEFAFEPAATTVEAWQQAELARRWESLAGRSDFGSFCDVPQPQSLVRSEVVRTARDPLKWRERLD
jgi:hypothetical protein